MSRRTSNHTSHNGAEPDVSSSNNNNNNNNNNVHDDDNHHHLSESVIKAIFLLLGVGILIPWNAFVSAKPYFQARLCNEETGKVIVNFELWFGLIWNFSSVVSLGLIICATAAKDYNKRQKQNNSHSPIPTTMDPLNPPALASSLETNTDNNDNNGGGEHGQGGTASHSFWLVMVPLALFALVFVMTDLLVLVPNISPHTFFTMTIIGLAICGTCGAIATAGILSTAGLFDSHVGINPFFSGQALGGVAVSLSNFVAATMEDPTSFWEQTCPASIQRSDAEYDFDFEHEYEYEYEHGQYYNGDNTMTTTTATTKLRKLLELDDEQQPTCSPYTEYDWAVFVYFFAGCIALGCCLVGYSYIHKYQQSEHRDDYEPVHDTTTTDTTATTVTTTIPTDNEEDQGDTVKGKMDESSPRIGLEMNNRVRERQEAENENKNKNETDSYHDEYPIEPSTGDALTLPAVTNDGYDVAEEQGITATTTTTTTSSEEETEMTVFWAIKGPAGCIFLTFAVTLCLFPSWISQLRSTHECESQHARMSNDLYVPFRFVVFNVGDLAGRLLSEKIPVERIRHLSLKLVLASTARILFLPLFLLCVGGDNDRTNSNSSMVIESDAYSLAIQLLFAFTNGILISCSFMHAPHLVAHSMGMQERASEMMTFAVYFGLLSGSLLSFPFSRLAAGL